MQQKKIISGLDVIKFIMAFFIVDIHVQGYLFTPPVVQEYIIHPVEDLAVPVFFVISSFLFFRKARYADGQGRLVLHFMKRLCILYLFWCVVWSPIIYIQKDYFHPMTVWIPIYIMRDFFFGNMFDASWFLGALLVGVPMVWGLSRALQRDVLVLAFPVMVYLYLQFVNDLPDALAEPYRLYDTFKDPHLAFPGGLLWIAIGYVLANKLVTAWIEKINNCVAWMAVLLFLVLMFFIPVIPKILCVTALFVAAYTWKLPECPEIYRRFRTYSILFYVIHDCFKKIPKQLFGWENGPVLFVVTIAFCFIASEMIMKMKDVKGLGWLKYAY
ncbi:MAG: acyltransferase family protein [Prevotellaceae bacterium]|nr:acyltransferase family protein [Prevotellaceae bacterium]